ncbi:MAG: hypothetical protein ABSG51_15240 [Terracidiphilus sp.]
MGGSDISTRSLDIDAHSLSAIALSARPEYAQVASQIQKVQSIRAYQKQLGATTVAGCSAIAITPSDYSQEFGASTTTSDLKAMAIDAYARVAHLDPFVRWTSYWVPRLHGMELPVDIVGFDADDSVRMATEL